MTGQRQRAAAPAPPARPARRWRSAAPRRPSRTVRAPAAAKRGQLGSVMPPSGPTTTTTSPSSGGPRRRPATRSRPRAAPMPSAAPATGAPPASAVPDRLGDDRARGPGATAWRRRRIPPPSGAGPSPRARPRQTTTLREACHGTTSSTPSSVAVSIACSSRPPLARACTRTSRGLGYRARRRTASSRAEKASLPVCVTVASARRPRPPSSTFSPGRSSDHGDGVPALGTGDLDHVPDDRRRPRRRRRRGTSGRS